MNMVAVFDEVISRKPAASEWLAWACLMRQTLCFGKAEDDLADSRLEKLAGLRRDRARAAVRDVVGMGLFEIAGKGKYGTVYRIPARFLDDSGHIGFNTNMGASETDAYGTYDDQTITTPDGAETTAPEHSGAYQGLVEVNRMLVEANQVLVNTNQDLVKTNQLLVNSLPKFGEGLTNSWSNAHQELVTDINKPKHTKTITNLTPDSGEGDEDAQERWPEHWGQAGKGGDGFQAWGEYAAMAAPQANKPATAATGLACHTVPTPAVDTAASAQAGGMAADALQYPPSLSAEERAEAPKKLDGLHPQIAQEVLDALAWMMANSKVKKSNIGLLCWMVREARNGTFDRTPALEWRKGQQQAQAKQETIGVTELNLLANEIRALQAIQKAGGVENPTLAAQVEGMKASYFQKLEAYKEAQVGNTL
jgi:hypothetical protein